MASTTLCIPHTTLHFLLVDDDVVMPLDLVPSPAIPLSYPTVVSAAEVQPPPPLHASTSGCSLFGLPYILLLLSGFCFRMSGATCFCLRLGGWLTSWKVVLF